MQYTIILRPPTSDNYMKAGVHSVIANRERYYFSDDCQEYAISRTYGDAVTFTVFGEDAGSVDYSKYSYGTQVYARDVTIKVAGKKNMAGEEVVWFNACSVVLGHETSKIYAVDFMPNAQPNTPSGVVAKAHFYGLEVKAIDMSFEPSFGGDMLKPAVRVKWESKYHDMTMSMESTLYHTHLSALWSSARTTEWWYGRNINALFKNTNVTIVGRMSFKQKESGGEIIMTGILKPIALLLGQAGMSDEAFFDKYGKRFEK